MTVAAARDAMIELFRTAWLADPVTQNVPLVFDDVAGDAPGIDANGDPTPYARVTVRHLEGGAETLGGASVGRDEYVGRFVVQCFGPKGDGYTQADALAEVALSALSRQRFSGTGIDGWFFETYPQEVPSETAHNQINVAPRFRYHRRRSA